MFRYTLAVFDDSPGYINRFLQYFRKRPNLPFDVIGFTSPEVLDEYMAGSIVDILLLSRDFYNRNQMEIIKESEEDTRTGFMQWPDTVREIVILGEQQDMNAAPKRLDRYRPMKQLEKDLVAICRDLTGKADITDTGRPEVIGIYSIEAGSDPYAFARYYIQGTDDLKKTLYIDLDTFSGLRLRLSLPAGENMSDLIFYYKSDQEMFRNSVLDTVYKVEPVNILAAPVCLKDLDEISYTGWSIFLRSIASTGGYDRIFLNITDSCRDMTGIFAACSSIFVFGLEMIPDSDSKKTESLPPDRLSAAEARAQCFRNYFVSKGRTDITCRFKPARKDIYNDYA